MNKNNKTHEIQVHFMEGIIMSERLLKNMSKDFKFEVLARYFYYISTLNGFHLMILVKNTEVSTI